MSSIQAFLLLYVHLMKINNCQTLVFCQSFVGIFCQKYYFFVRGVFFCQALGMNATTFRIHECNKEWLPEV